MRKTCISDFFYILKINRIMPFCNLFIGRPSYQYFLAGVLPSTVGKSQNKTAFLTSSQTK